MTSILSLLWKAGNQIKNWSYDYNVLDQIQLPIPVVSVGNLSSGGTGKTPVVQALFNHYKHRYGKIAIVSRNYKAITKNFAQVDLLHPNPAAYFGDEPTWLARFCPGSYVFVGPQKYETAYRAWQQVEPELIIVDDGFQHRSLARNLDLVLIDVSSDPNIKLIPAGLYREDLSSLKRADYVLLTKVNWVEPGVLAAWRARIPDDFPIVEIDFDLQIPERVLGFSGKVAAFAGLANSEKFKDLIEEKTNRPLDRFWSYADHYDYPPVALDELHAYLEKNPDAVLLTTEKDAVKLGKWMVEHPQVLVVPMTIRWGLGADEFLVRLSKINH